MTTSTTNAKVETYRLTAANGRHIRLATQVVLANGEVVRFTERMPKRQALAQAAVELGRR